jgi:hypothetical protein
VPVQNGVTLALNASRGTPLSHYRRAAHRQPPPLPPKWEPRRGATRPPPLAEFVFLSVLLHALAILLFGAPGGGTREGRALWGTLDVVITRAVPRPEPVPERPAPAPHPAVVPPAVVAPAPPAPAAAPVDVPYSFPPLLDRIASPERTVEMAPVPQVPPPTELQAVAPSPAPAVPPAEPAPEAPPAVAEMPPVPAPLPFLAPQAAAPAMLAPPTVEALAPPIPVEAPAPPIPAPLLEPLPLLEPRTSLQPMAESPTLEVPPEPAPSVAAPAAVAPPAEAARIDPPRAPAAQESSPFRARAPSARDDASGYDPTAPPLDAEALRKRAGELAREGVGNRALLAFPMPPVPARKSKLEAAIENARKPDCKTAYQGLGLAAIVPLIANEFGEGTCRW